MWNAEDSREIEDGGVELLVDPSKVRRTLSDSAYSLGRLKILIDELMSVTIELKVTNGMWAIGGLLDHVVESPATKRDPLTGGTRHLWRVRLGVAFVQLIKNDVPRFYDPSPITRLQNGISQAIARHVLSHSSQPNGGWKLDGLIEAVAGTLTAVSLRNKRREVRLDRSALSEIGIIVDDDRVFLEKRACSTGPIKPEKSSARVAAARCRVAPARQNVKTCSSGPINQPFFSILQNTAGPMSAAPEGPLSSAISPPVADATTPQGVSKPAGGGVSTATTQQPLQDPSPAGHHHPRRGSQRKLRGGEGVLITQLNLFDESAVV